MTNETARNKQAIELLVSKFSETNNDSLIGIKDAWESAIAEQAIQRSAIKFFDETHGLPLSENAKLALVDVYCSDSPEKVKRIAQEMTRIVLIADQLLSYDQSLCERNVFSRLNPTKSEQIAYSILSYMAAIIKKTAEKNDKRWNILKTDKPPKRFAKTGCCLALGVISAVVSCLAVVAFMCA